MSDIPEDIYEYLGYLGILGKPRAMVGSYIEGDSAAT